MSRTPPSSEKAKIAQAALQLAAAKGWEQVRLQTILKQARLGSKSGSGIASKRDILPLIADEVTRKALSEAEGGSGSSHEILFDLLMARFDVLQRNRKGILSIAQAARREKETALALGRVVLKGMYATAAAAKSAGKVKMPAALLAAGLLPVYAYAFLIWRRDTSRDMSKTMAALDRALRVPKKAKKLLKD